MVLQLVQATSDEIVEVGYAGLTVRSVARRAGVAPATAYNYFSSKDHLLAEVLWRHMQALPPVEEPGRRPMAERLTEAVRDMVLFTTESPALVDACTVALLSANPDVKHLRDRIGAQIHRRLAAVVGADVDPLVVRVLETSFSGSLLAAGTGHMPFDDIPRLMAAAAELMVDGTSTSARSTVEPPRHRRHDHDHRHGHRRGPVTYSPYAYEIHEDPYPVYARLRAEAPVYRNEELDFWALSRHADVLAAFRNVDGFSNAQGVSLDPSRLRSRRPPLHVVPGPRPAPPHPHALTGGQGLHPLQSGPDGGPDPGHRRRAPRARPRGRHVRLHRRLRRQAAHGRDLRPGGGAAGRPAGDPPAGRPGGAPRGRAVRRPPGRHGGRPHPDRLLPGAWWTSGAPPPATT